jgi:PadR family transcriptional regulator, regulatory protein AphA
MPRENKTRYAVLGLLSYGPASGYDIRRIYARSLGNFWNESYGHIYPILRRLVDEGLATRAVEQTGGRPDRHVYAITPAGREALLRWLHEPAEPTRQRVEAMLKIFLAGDVGPAAAIAHVRRFREEHTALLDQYAGIADQIAGAGDPRSPYWLLTVGCGEHVSRACVAWCDEAIESLNRLSDATGEPAPTRQAKGGA